MEAVFRNRILSFVCRLGAIVTLATGQMAWANDDGLKRCRAIASPTDRLACYDNVVDTAARSELTRPALPGTTATPVRDARQNAAAPSPPASTRPTAVPAIAQFGLTQRTPESDIKFVESEIAGLFEGWGPNTRIRLRNGQVWQIDDGSTGVCGCTDPKVKISKGLFGVYYLEVDGKGHAPKVRRVN
jgi:hypothetical protein